MPSSEAKPNPTSVYLAASDEMRHSGATPFPQQRGRQDHAPPDPSHAAEQPQLRQLMAEPVLRVICRDPTFRSREDIVRRQQVEHPDPHALERVIRDHHGGRSAVTLTLPKLASPRFGCCRAKYREALPIRGGWGL